MTLRRVAITSLLCAAACRTGDAPDTSGTPVAETWTIEPVAEAHPAEIFQRIVSLAADDGGNLYVADRGAHTIRVFDSAGRELRTIGREGSGPGEFSDLYSLAWSGDTLVAYDPGNSRVELVSTDGRHVASWAGSRITGGDVRLFQAGARFFMPAWRPAASGREIERLLVTTGPADDGVRDTLLFPADVETADPTVVVCHVPDGRITFFDTPFTSRLITAVSPAGELVLARTNDYRIAFFDRTATAQRFTLFGATPVPITSAEWDSVSGEFRAFREKFSSASCEPDAPTRPVARPALRSIEFDDEGRMWVEATVPGGYHFHVYDAAGGMLANVPAPERDATVPFVVRKGRLYLVAESESGEQLVRIFRVAASPTS